PTHSELQEEGTDMISRFSVTRRASITCLAFMAIVAGLGVFNASRAHAQATPPAPPTVVNTGNIVNIVGGVRVSVDGVLAQQDERSRAEVLEARRKAMQTAAGDLNQPAKLRMVSLRKLDDAIKQCAESGRPLPDEIRYLAGLQRVQ